MLTHNSALELIQKSCDSLQRVGLLEKEITIQNSTVLLGSGSPLDSIAFVTFVTELEDRLNRSEGQEDLFLILKDIHEYNTDDSSLTAGVLASYLTRLTGGEA
jgi:acyl carrier protein